MGCKHQCIFCNQHKIAQLPVKPFEIENTVESYLQSQIKKYGKIHNKYKIKEISFYGGSFTCMKQDKMIQYLEKAYTYVKMGLIDSLRLSTRPDCIDDNILNILHKYSVKTIELGAQTLNDGLLKILKRGHNLEHVLNASNLIKSKGFNLGIQLMVGVPGENDDIIKKNIEILIKKIKPKFIRIYPLIVLKDTYLEKMYQNNEYSPLTIEETVKRCKKIVEKCSKKDIEVIRIGLQSTEVLRENIVAGPFLDNLGQIVKEGL